MPACFAIATVSAISVSCNNKPENPETAASKNFVAQNLTADEFKTLSKKVLSAPEEDRPFVWEKLEKVIKGRQACQEAVTETIATTDKVNIYAMDVFLSKCSKDPVNIQVAPTEMVNFIRSNTENVEMVKWGFAQPELPAKELGQHLNDVQELLKKTESLPEFEYHLFWQRLANQTIRKNNCMLAGEKCREVEPIKRATIKFCKAMTLKCIELTKRIK